MVVLVRWCYNVDCHSVGRVPSSYPRGVRLPTALLCVLSYAFSFCYFCLSWHCPFWSFRISSVTAVVCALFVRVAALCLVSFSFSAPAYVHVLCQGSLCRFFLDFRFPSLSHSIGPVCSLSFLFPLVRCASLCTLCLCSTCSPRPCLFTCVLFRPSPICEYSGTAIEFAFHRQQIKFRRK